MSYKPIPAALVCAPFEEAIEVKLIMKDKKKIRIRTNSRKYITSMIDSFTKHVSGYYHMPLYRSGQWNGKTCMINGTNHSFPYGLLIDYIRFHKAIWPEVKLEISEDVKKIFRGFPLEIKYDLKLQPRPYQKESIESCLKYAKGIIRSATASGKSAVISYVIKNLLDNKLAKKALIVVPSLSLIEQFHSDMVDYGIKYSIGKVYADSHKWDEDIVISTWQSLSKNHKMLKNYDIVIVDETHLCKSRELKKIMSLSTAHYKFGFTGTLHSNELDNWNTKAYIGPILKDYPSGLLADQGFISKCNVKAILMNYLHPPKGTYLEIKDIIFRNQFRLKFIANLVESLDHNVLLLVGLLDEGHMLKKCLEKYTKKEVVFLSGKDNIETREDWRQQMMQGKTNIALIATYGIMAQGVNIPNLKYMIMASPFKAKIRVLQSIGRTLRLHENKQEGSFIFDICDQVRFLKKHGEIRHKFYQTEKFNIEVQEVNEG